MWNLQTCNKLIQKRSLEKVYKLIWIELRKASKKYIKNVAKN